MAARIDLQALQKELDAFRTKFDGFAQRAVASAEGLRDGHLSRLREYQGGSLHGAGDARSCPLGAREGRRCVRVHPLRPHQMPPAAHPLRSVLRPTRCPPCSDGAWPGAAAGRAGAAGNRGQAQ